ncbi:hypothetical protein DL96DRAFT_1711454 [Flagelloscypha sp. PMI_526]|nr:hypothetical protein DL96DRAFT_1711454 [Flagelloscypha sp. PMI_526]
MVLPFIGAAPLGRLDNVKPGELVTFRKMSPFESCGIIGPCFCDDSGCYEPFEGAKYEETPNLPVEKPEIKPVCVKAPCKFGGNFPFSQTEDASAKNGTPTSPRLSLSVPRSLATSKVTSLSTGATMEVQWWPFNKRCALGPCPQPFPFKFPLSPKTSQSQRNISSIPQLKPTPTSICLLPGPCPADVTLSGELASSLLAPKATPSPPSNTPIPLKDHFTIAEVCVTAPCNSGGSQYEASDNLSGDQSVNGLGKEDEDVGDFSDEDSKEGDV